MTLSSKSRTALLAGAGFLLPNLLGFLAFTLFPLITSLVMAFTNWDLRLHNMFHHAPLRFVGFENFGRLLAHPDFWQYLGNTIFLMLGIPFSIAASLLAALLLTWKPDRPNRYRPALLLAGLGMGMGCGVLVACGAAGSAFSILIGGVVTFLVAGGVVGGPAFYRTVYYLPNFTAGVATFLLWKKMYDPHSGPINAVLQPVLDHVSVAASATPLWEQQALVWGLRILALAVFIIGSRKMIVTLMSEWSEPVPRRGGQVAGILFRFVLLFLVSWLVWKTGAAMSPFFAAAQTGLKAPEWLTDYYWAKPAIMIMAFWASIGSNNMLLYIAALGNVPLELKEAASIDGAGPVQGFCHVTWPQLAPVTFFIVIMSTIGGLQGGFEMARTMTNGGPGGATTTLSYFVFSEGFSTGRLGYASAIAWSIFLLVLIVVFINWKIGSRITND